MRRLCLIVTLLCPVLLAAQSWAAESDLLRDLDRLRQLRDAVEVDAEQVDYDAATRRLMARGTVRFAIDRVVVAADEVAVDLDDRVLTARGRVALSDGVNRLEGDEIEYDLRTNRGVVRQGRGLLSPGLSVEGAEIRRVGDREFHLLDGRFTSCRICQPEGTTPDWEFRAAEATVHLDDYVVADHTSFWLKGIPALYFPRLILPVSPRRTGFLIPRVGAGGRDGFKFALPFFWAISRSQDLTVTPTYRSRRGPDFLGEYRYILGEESRGSVETRYLYDTDQDRSRSEFRWRHDQAVTPALSLKADINYLSDDALARDYVDSTVADRTQRTLTSNVFVTHTTSRLMLLGLVGSDNDLSQSDAARSSRLPEGRLQWLPTPLLDARLLGEGDLAAAYLEQNRSVDVGRFDLRPVLHLPLDLAPGVTATTSLAVRETAYTGSRVVGGDRNRVLLEVEERLAARLMRRFSLAGGRLQHLTHVVEPSLTYQYVPWVDQQDFPQFDAVDFVPPQNRLTFRLGNRLMARSREAEGADPVFELAGLAVEQSLNLQPRRREFSDVHLVSLTPERVDQALEQRRSLGNGFSLASERTWSNTVLRGHLTPVPRVSLRGALAINPEGPRTDGINAALGFQWPERLRVELGHTYVRDRQASGLVAQAEVQASRAVRLDLLSRYEGTSGRFLEHGVGLRYASCCWEVAFRYTHRSELTDRPAENDFKVMFDIKLPTPPAVRALGENAPAGR